MICRGAKEIDNSQVTEPLKEGILNGKYAVNFDVLCMKEKYDSFLETFFDKRSDKVDYGTSGIAEWYSFKERAMVYSSKVFESLRSLFYETR